MDGVRKTKAQMQLDLTKGTKKNKKGFYRYINQKRKVSYLVSNIVRLVSMARKRPRYLTTFLSQSSLITAPHKALKYLVWYSGIREATSLPL